jgi:hypothetical protein
MAVARLTNSTANPLQARVGATLSGRVVLGRPNGSIGAAKRIVDLIV